MEKLAAKEAARKASDDDDAKSHLEADVAQEELHKALQDLAEFQKVVARLVYKGYLIVAIAGLVTPMRESWPSFALVIFKKTGSHV